MLFTSKNKITFCKAPFSPIFYITTALFVQVWYVVRNHLFKKKYSLTYELTYLLTKFDKRLSISFDNPLPLLTSKSLKLFYHCSKGIFPFINHCYCLGSSQSDPRGNPSHNATSHPTNRQSTLSNAHTWSRESIYCPRRGWGIRTTE